MTSHMLKSCVSTMYIEISKYVLKPNHQCPALHLLINQNYHSMKEKSDLFDAIS